MGRVVALAVVALALAGPSTAGGQELPPKGGRAAPHDTATQDTAPPPPTRQDAVPSDTVRIPHAGLGYDPATVSFSINLGRTGGDPAQTQPVQVYRRTTTGAVVDSMILDRAVALQGGFYGGASATLSLSRRWGLRAEVGVATTELKATYQGADTAYVTSANAVAGVAADLRVWSLESAIQYRLPSDRRLQPYVELGAAISRWGADGGLPEAAALEAGITRVQLLAAVGGVLPLSERFSARLHASSRSLGTPISPLTVGDTVATSSALVLLARQHDTSRFADGARELLGLLRLEAGISFQLGRQREAPPADRGVRSPVAAGKGPQTPRIDAGTPPGVRGQGPPYADRSSGSRSTATSASRSRSPRGSVDGARRRR